MMVILTRPEVLNAFFRPTSSLKNVGAKLHSLCEKLCGGRLLDLLFHLPRDIKQRHFVPSALEAIGIDDAVLRVVVYRHIPPMRKRLPWKVQCQCDGGHQVDLVFFHANPSYLRDVLKEEKAYFISGKITLYQSRYTITHPDMIVATEFRSTIREVFPLYPLTEGLHPKGFSKMIAACFQTLPELPEWIDPALCQEQGWKSFHDTLFLLHHPEETGIMEARHPLRLRLAYDECLAHQVTLVIFQLHHQKSKGRKIQGSAALRKEVLESLPFKPTLSQKKAFTDIAQDMQSEKPMLRFLQGDVGSGKTLVAMMAMLNAVESGAQACLMTPGEILSRQHFNFFHKWLNPLGVDVGFLSGAVKGKARIEVLQRIADGRCAILIGTHALFQKAVQWKDLAVMVVDEQHRFGVHQRLALYEKGNAPDILMMSATPIPRSLTLTLWGDVSLSQLKEKPAGRKPIKTRVLPASRLKDVIKAIGRSVAQGDKIYWICPLVEKSEKNEATPVEERAQYLAKYFGTEKVALVHGQMSALDKQKAMYSFIEGSKNILVATTVIEVGVDVQEANRMVIEDAHLFGLAQLHQLRGRIGRGGQESVCLLLYQEALSETAHQRLEIIRCCEDGFFIAEEDLRLRGGGDRLGVRQSGMPSFRFVDIFQHHDIMVKARDQARFILKKDPYLRSQQGQALRLLLNIFECDDVLETLRSG